MHTIHRSSFIVHRSRQKSRNAGFTILISVLMVGAVAFSVGLSLMYMSGSSINTTRILQDSLRGSILANACAEDALEKVRKTEGTVTSGDLTLGTDTCSYTVANTGGTTRTIHAAATVNNLTKSVDITLSNFASHINITSWIEK